MLQIRFDVGMVLTNVTFRDDTRDDNSCTRGAVFSVESDCWSYSVHQLSVLLSLAFVKS